LSFLKRYDEAEKAYSKGLKLDPNNAQLKSGLEEARTQAQREYLRWLKAVFRTFQDIDFDVSLLPLVIT